MTPNIGPKNALKESMKDKIPIWLKYTNQDIPTTKPKTAIIKPALFKDNKLGRKFTKVYCDGIKFAIKFVDADAMIINNKTKFIINKLSNLPIISVGFVSILDKFSGSCFKKASTPVTINKAKKEKIIKFSTKLKFPFFNSFSFLTYLEKSPKVKITIAK